jgi:CrcB protein
MSWLYIAIGGAVGALARQGLGGWVQARAGERFPLGTLTVNVLGCLLLGIAIRVFETARVSPELRAMIAVGVLGAFTTFSTYTYETVLLIQGGAWTRAFLYAVGSLALGLAAVHLGMTLAGHVFAGPA